MVVVGPLASAVMDLPSVKMIRLNQTYSVLHVADRLGARGVPNHAAVGDDGVVVLGERLMALLSAFGECAADRTGRATRDVDGLVDAVEDILSVSEDETLTTYRLGPAERSGAHARLGPSA